MLRGPVEFLAFSRFEAICASDGHIVVSFLSGMGVMLHNRAEYGMGVGASPRKVKWGVGREVGGMLWIVKRLLGTKI